MVKFNTHQNRIRTPLDTKKRKSRVDLTGFVPKERRIRQLIEAGKRLPQGQYGTYDFEGDVDIEKIQLDPTRQKNFDMAEAQEMLEERVIPTTNRVVQESQRKRAQEALEKKPEQGTDSGEKE